MKEETLTIENILAPQFIGLTATIKDWGFSISNNEIIRKKNIIYFYEIFQLQDPEKNNIFTEEVLEKMFFFFSEHELSVDIKLDDKVVQMITEFFKENENR